MSLVIKILRAKRINILSETLALGETRNYNGKVKKKNQAKCMQKREAILYLSYQNISFWDNQAWQYRHFMSMSYVLNFEVY